jgi:hypothetical protein
MSEREVKAERALRTGVAARGGMCIKLAFPGTPGAPDRMLLLPGGRLFFVELKRAKGGALEASQEVLFPMMERRGFKVHRVDGVMGVAQFLKEFVDV